MASVSTTPVPLIHIGFPKCASTWLQQFFYHQSHGFQQIFRPLEVKLAMLDRTIIDPVVSARKGWERISREILCYDMVPVCTSEHLAGSFLFGSPDSLTIADNLKAIFPEARILILIREQKALIASIYKTLIAQGSHRSIADLLSEQAIDPSVGSWVDYLRFHRVIGRYVDLYGNENVHILPYEVLCMDHSEQLQAIKKFAGVSSQCMTVRNYPFDQVINPNSDQLLLYLVRIFNRLLINDYNNRGLLREGDKVIGWRQKHLNRGRRMGWFDRPFQAVFKSRIDKLASTKFEQSNRLLVDRFDLPLQEYGYAL